jgi:hypothetical protein
VEWGDFISEIEISRITYQTIRMSRKPQKQQKAANFAPGRQLSSRFNEMRDAAIGGLSYLECMMNPHEMSPQRVPDDIVATSAVFKSPFITSLDYAGIWNASNSGSDPIDPMDPINGETIVGLFPGAVASIWRTRGEDVALFDEKSPMPLPVIEPVLTSSKFVTSSTSGDLTGGVQYFSHGLRLGSVGVIPRLNSQGQPVYEMEMRGNGIPPSNAGTVVAIFQETTNRVVPEGLAATMTFLYTDGSSSQSTVAIIASQSQIQFAFDPEDGELVRAFILSINDNRPLVNWQFSLTGSHDAAAGVPTVRTVARSCTTYIVSDTRDMTNLDQTNNERTTALAGLVTYMGSDLRNGGVISGARLPMGATPTEAPDGDIYGYLARLPVFAEDYPLKVGCYAWWLPDDQQEYFFTPYLHPRSDNIPTTSSLWFAMRRDNPEQEVRLDVVQHMEVLTRSVQFSSEVGPANPSFTQLLLIAKLIPAVCENAKHLDWLRKVATAVKKKALNPANWVKLLKSGAQFLQGQL